VTTAFFLDNQYRGGVDTFLIQLINHWPEDGRLRLYCNRHHPGLETIRAMVHRPLQISTYGDSISWTLFSGKARIPLDRFYVVRAAVVVFQRIMPPILFLANLIRFSVRFRMSGAHSLLVVNGGYPASATARSASLAWRIAGKGGVNIHNFHSHASPSNGKAKRMNDFLDRLILRASTYFVTVSRSCELSLRKRDVFLNSDRIRVIPNGIADPGFPLHRPETQKLSCLMLGTYHEYKGHSFLLEAFAQIRERHATTELNMYGDGSEADRVRIEGLIDRFGLRECAFLHGFVTDPDALIRNADVLVLPSQAHESFGLTIVEAMARGVPVVATRVGGIPEVLEDGVQGFVCSPSDASAFAAAISRLLSSEELRRDLGAAGRRRYEQHFRAEQMSKAYHSLLCS